MGGRVAFAALLVRGRVSTPIDPGSVIPISTSISPPVRTFVVASTILFLLALFGEARPGWAQIEDEPPSPSPRLFDAEQGNSTASPYLSRLSATKDDPIFATYAAPLRRSEYTVDEGYQFAFHEPQRALRFATDHTGDWGVAFHRDGAGRYRPSDFHEEPVITVSYSDLVAFHYRPYEDVRVESVFQVYNSHQALQHLTITNEGDEAVTLRVVPFLRRSEAFRDITASGEQRYVTFRHRQEPDGWTERMTTIPHVTQRRNVFRLSEPAEAAGAYARWEGEGSAEMTFRGSRADLGSSPRSAADSARVVALRATVTLAPGATKDLRVVRGVAGVDSDRSIVEASQALMNHEVSSAIRTNEALYRSVPRFDFADSDRRMMYWSAFNLMRQCMLPPEGKAGHNYYVFSREPTWGWGHGGQVFHESLAMLGYVSLDAQSALHSQRVYMERQWENGYIPYRTGPYLDETIFARGSFTSSAPWYSYENWELYQATGDRTFLQDAYESGTAFYTWWLNNRDQDGDGLAEWGGHAILESVRDADVAVWEDVGWPSNFEAPELNSMLVKEAEALANMAEVLGDSAGAVRWRREAQTRTKAIQKTFWDEETDFFYYVDREDHDFTFDDQEDLKRREITGFIPLWAGTATDAQARRLVEEHLTDSTAFWRPYGVPSLAADDPFYDPQGYWNGPVWVEWQFLLVRGLQKYGYHGRARELATRVFDNVIHHLKHDHTFWEFYSPDTHWAGHHQTYIWTGLVARMVMDLREAKTGSSPASR